jgi:hypothetical protein
MNSVSCCPNRLLKEMSGSKLLIILLFAAFVIAFGGIAQAQSQDLVKFGSDLMIEAGMNVRNAVVIAGDITVDGRVEQDVVAIGGSIILTNRAVVGRNVVAISGSIERSTGADVGGNLTEVNIPGLYTLVSAFSGGNWTGPFLFFALWPMVSFIGLLALAILITSFFPGPIETVSNRVEENPIRSGIVGTVGMLLIVPLGILLAISIIGLVLIPVEIFAVSIGFLLGYVAVARLIGRKLYRSLKRPPSVALWETFWGAILLGLIGLIPVVGWLVNALAALLGFGGVWAAIRHRHPQRKI